MGKGGTFPSALVIINTFNLHDDSMNWLYHLIDRVTELVAGREEPACQCTRWKRRRCDPWKKGIATHWSCLEKPVDRGAW